jgi:uncharacterized oligopeptide transporter (OPT) family protein
MLCGVSGLAFAIGVYLPLATMAPLYVGGCVRALAERGRGLPPVDGRPYGGGPAAKERVDTGVLAASGLVAGEGLAGVLVAGLVAGGVVPKPLTTRLAGEAGELAALAAAFLVCVFLFRGGRGSGR